MLKNRPKRATRARRCPSPAGIKHSDSIDCDFFEQKITRITKILCYLRCLLWTHPQKILSPCLETGATPRNPAAGDGLRYLPTAKTRKRARERGQANQYRPDIRLPPFFAPKPASPQSGNGFQKNRSFRPDAKSFALDLIHNDAKTAQASPRLKNATQPVQKTNVACIQKSRL